MPSCSTCSAWPKRAERPADQVVDVVVELVGEAEEAVWKVSVNGA